MSDRADVPVGYRRWLPEKPKIVVLCGSTRFMYTFHDAGWEETLKGNIVLSVGVVTTSSGSHSGEALGSDTVEMLDELHWRKIDLADEVLVLNVDGYIGYSTQREIEYAEMIGKPIRYLVATAIGDGE